MKIEAPKIGYFKDLLESTKSALSQNAEDFERRYAQYNGDKSIDGSPEDASHIWNITYELIESKISTNIPSPKITPERRTNKTEWNAHAVESLCNALRDRLPFEEMNDLDERYTYIYGGSAWLVEWDESIRTHDTVGGVAITLINPCNVYGQPNVYRVEDMQYIFVRFDTTRDELVRRYGVTYSDTIKDAGAETDVEHTEDTETVTVYVCYYKDDSDNVCLYAWSGDLELADITDYYSRKRRICKVCGRREELCTCDGKHEFELQNEEYEELKHDIQLQHSGIIREQDPTTGQVIEREAFETIPGMMPVFHDDGTRKQKKETVYNPVTGIDGQPIIDDATGLPRIEPQEIMQDVMEPTRIPYYKPKSFPIVIRRNVSKDRSLWGQSDCDVIRPHQQTVNKLKSRMLQKMMRSGITPVLPMDAEVGIDNSIFGKVIRMRPGENKAQYGVIDTTPNVSEETSLASIEYDNAKRLVGITDSYQGQSDTTAKSGKAKQIQVAQSAGRLESTRRMKNAAYAFIDRVIFEYYLAYADEPRPLAYKDEYGQVRNLAFNRYDFLELDEEHGEYYYDDDYLFSVDMSGASNMDKFSQWEMQTQDYGNGLYGQPGTTDAMLRLWMMRERSGYPDARQMVERLQSQRRAEIQQAQAQQAQMQAQQAQMAQKAGGEQ